MGCYDAVAFMTATALKFDSEVAQLLYIPQPSKV